MKKRKPKRSNYTNVEINNTQQNRKCLLYGDRDEKINPVISENSNLAQRKYKSRHDWMVKIIHWETYKKSTFDHTTIWYMHKPEYDLKNETWNSLGF